MSQIPFADAAVGWGSGLVAFASIDGHHRVTEREECAENSARLQARFPVVMRAVSYSMCWRYLRDHDFGGCLGGLVSTGPGRRAYMQ